MEVAAIPNELLPLGSPFIALFSLVPLYIALYRARTCRETFLLMFLQALTVHLGSSFWLANFRDFAVFTLGASALGTAAEAGLTGIFFFLHPLYERAHSRLQEPAGLRPGALPGRILWFCAVWITWEWFKSTGFLAYPWGTLFLAAYRWKIFTQIAAVTGVWGVSFLYALCSALTAEGIMLLGTVTHAQAPRAVVSAYRQAAAFTLCAFAASGIYGLCEWFMPRIPEKYLHTVIVQQNIDPWEAPDNAGVEISKRLTEQAVRKMRSEEQEPDLVVWSEGVLNRPFPFARYYYSEEPGEESLSAFIRRMGIPFIIGGDALVNPARRHYENSAILFDRKGEFAGFYSKIHLVPFAEAIPFPDNPLVQFFMEEIVKFSAGWSAGSQYVLFRIPAGKGGFAGRPLEYGRPAQAVIPLNSDGCAYPQVTAQYTGETGENPDNFVSFTTPICFEDAFPDVCRKLHKIGSEVFINITNDSWSQTKSAEYQHFAAASYLAIEFRSTLVRCANAGYSVVLDPAGRILADMPLFTEGAMGTQVPVYRRTQTCFAALGDWFAWLLMGGLAAQVLYMLCTSRLPWRRKGIRLCIQIEFRKTGGGQNA
ncbi:MAG: apolipoprotein N-acyltransferase [Treponema sp.]|nr:apolipoprotein N-acyltransferase [Treponema sp.]